MGKGNFCIDPSLEAVVGWLVGWSVKFSPLRLGWLVGWTPEAKMHQYQIVGRAAPTNKNPTPKIYRMRTWRCLGHNVGWVVSERYLFLTFSLVEMKGAMVRRLDDEGSTVSNSSGR